MTDGIPWQVVIDLPDGQTRYSAQKVVEAINAAGAVPYEARVSLPPRVLLADVVHWAMQHQYDRPTHGVNCACADEMIRQVRLATEVIGADALIENRSETAMRAQQRVDWVLATAGALRRRH